MKCNIKSLLTDHFYLAAFSREEKIHANDSMRKSRVIAVQEIVDLISQSIFELIQIKL